MPVNGESKQWHEWSAIVFVKHSLVQLKRILVFVKHSPEHLINHSQGPILTTAGHLDLSLESCAHTTSPTLKAGGRSREREGEKYNILYLLRNYYHKICINQINIAM